MKTFVLLFCFLILSSSVLAAPINDCHCFKVRSFDVANPESSDEYLSFSNHQRSHLVSLSCLQIRVYCPRVLCFGSKRRESL